MWTLSVGRVVYNPKRPGSKKTQRLTPWWVIVEVDKGIELYYRNWIKKMWGLELQPPMWGPHITLLNDRDIVRPEFQHNWKKYHGKTVMFEYSVDIEQHWKFFVLPVKCDAFDQIREELGIVRKQPYHITIGRME